MRVHVFVSMCECQIKLDFLMFLIPPLGSVVGSLGDYDENEHQPGYTEELQDFVLLPSEEQVC